VALLRRLLANRQVSPTGLAFVPMLIETAITYCGKVVLAVMKNARAVQNTTAPEAPGVSLLKMCSIAHQGVARTSGGILAAGIPVA